ncbi:MAG: hypothetical protein ACRC0Q_04910 [Kurthia gibsonii]|uniref:Uncharacterized protein n=1 Tax=Kurthia gibsonii TaxID=33946 RepID=A0ABU9LNW7_9BACL|nr:hypothetical protein [Kurthia gibsonii]HZG10745.1 hypothetical protein [Kurthia gibsonii]
MNHSFQTDDGIAVLLSHDQLTRGSSLEQVQEMSESKVWGNEWLYITS